MKIKDVNGQEISIRIDIKKYSLGKIFRSKLQDLTRDKILEVWSHEIILEDFFIPKSHKLSVDFFIPRLGIVIEVDPEKSAHSKYIPYFHGQRTEHNFAKQKGNDIAKEIWAEWNKFKFIRIKSEKDIEKLNG